MMRAFFVVGLPTAVIHLGWLALDHLIREVNKCFPTFLDIRFEGDDLVLLCG